MPPLARAARILVLLAWMGMITYWSSQGTLPIDRPDVASVFHDFQHRFAHLLAFGLMGLLGQWAFDGWSRASFLAVLATSVFAVTDEFHQSFVPGRRAAIDDWALDTVSAALAIYLFAWLRRTRLQPALSAVGPWAVAAAFAIALALAARPAISTALGTRPSSSALARMLPAAFLEQAVTRSFIKAD
jgi:VanZ family protein